MTPKKKYALALIVDGGIAVLKSIPIIIATRKINRTAIIGMIEVFDGLRTIMKIKDK